MTQVFLIKRQRIVAGLRWVPLAGAEGASPKAELKEAAATYGIENPSRGLTVALPDGRAYGAIVPPRSPASANDAYSGAAWLAQVAHHPTLLVQRVSHRDNNWWVVMVRAGAVDPSTDVILGEQQAIDRIDRALIDSYNQSESLRVLVGTDPPNSANLQQLPWESDVDEADFPRVSRRVLLDLAGMVGDDAPPSDTRVRQIAGIHKAWIYGAVLAAACVVALIAGNAWMKRHKAAADLAEAQARLQQETATQGEISSLRDARIIEAVAQALAEDTATPAPQDVLYACASTSSLVGNKVAGWDVTTIDCNAAGSVSVALVRSDILATNADLAAAASARGWPLSVDPTGNVASINLPLSSIASRARIAAPNLLPNYEGIVLRDGTLLQNYQLSANGQVQLAAPAPRGITYLDPDKEASPDANERFQPVPQDRSYLTGKITVNGTGLWTLGGLPIDAPHLRVTRVTIQPQQSGVAGDKYTVEAIYVVSNA